MFPQIFGKYVLERELASGGMARVYLATLRGAVGFEKRLVVKQIRPELALDDAFVRRFVEEAKIAVELSHPNIVPVYELGVELGIYYIAMELCEGLTLTEILAETGPLDAAEGAHVGIEICRALDYAHRRGNIVHRDVTPRNVLLDEEGAVRLIDFGIAAPVSGGRDNQRVEVFGSPGHMPLEQIRGERLTPATDVFAVGALLMEAWTGRPPFRRATFEASAQALHEPPPALVDEAEGLAAVSDIMAQAVALRAEDRPQDAEALARRLRDFSRQFDSGDVAKRLGTRVQRALRRGYESSPWLPGEGSGSQTPATPPMPTVTPATVPGGGTPVTQTFAARGDVAQWTRKLASLPPPPDAAGSTPPPPPPSVVDVDEPQTRALPRSAAPEAAKRPFPWVVVASATAVVGAIALASSRQPAPPVVVAKPVPPPVATLSVAAVVPEPLRSAEPAPSASLSASVRPASPKPAVSNDAASAQLRLTADPPATVTVVGGRVAQTAVTPVRGLKLPPGTYAVTFRSPTFGEPVAARVELSAGASRSVHADFRAALPTVVVR